MFFSYKYDYIVSIKCPVNTLELDIPGPLLYTLTVPISQVNEADSSACAQAKVVVENFVETYYYSLYVTEKKQELFTNQPIRPKLNSESYLVYTQVTDFVRSIFVPGEATSKLNDLDN